MSYPLDEPDPLLALWTGILSSANKTSSLKFALARALLDIAKSAKSADSIAVSRAELADYFIKYFWFQILMFRLRQSAAPNTAPLIFRHLAGLKMSPGQATKGPATITAEQYAIIRADLVQSGFKYVLPCFHNLRHDRKDQPQFYLQTRKGIVVTAGAVDFLRQRAPLLRGYLDFHWTKWLEAFNTAPRIASKVAFVGERRRTSLRRLGRVLAPWQPHCFYCPQPLAGNYEVDHVIPWAYIFQDPLWDLVLACPRCNRNKRDALPPAEILEKLIARNAALGTSDKTMRNLLDHSYHSLPGYPEHTVDRALKHLYDSAQVDGF